MNKNLIRISTITSKYQTVIPVSIRRAAGLNMNNELVWHVIYTKEQPMVLVSAKPKNWAQYLSGLGKDIWKGVKTDEYIRNLRREW